jgi:hypothetical protein
VDLPGLGSWPRVGAQGPVLHSAYGNLLITVLHLLPFYPKPCSVIWKNGNTLSFQETTIKFLSVIGLADRLSLPSLSSLSHHTLCGAKEMPLPGCLIFKFFFGILLEVTLEN